MLIRQNFEFACGTDFEATVDIDPDTVSLVGTQLTLRVYEQDTAVPLGDPIITKNIDDGLQITDPDYGLLIVTFERDDTVDLTPKNYWFEVSQDGTDGESHVPVAQGILTLTRAKNPALEIT